MKSILIYCTSIRVLVGGLICIFLGNSGLVFGAEVHLIDPSVLGKSLSECSSLFLTSDAEATQLRQIRVDFKDGYVNGLVVVYRDISVEQMRTVLNSRYGADERADLAMCGTLGIWKNEKERFVLQLSTLDFLDEGGIILVYLPLSLQTTAQPDE